MLLEQGHGTVAGAERLKPPADPESAALALWSLRARITTDEIETPTASGSEEVLVPSDAALNYDPIVRHPHMHTEEFIGDSAVATAVTVVTWEEIAGMPPVDAWRAYFRREHQLSGHRL